MGLRKLKLESLETRRLLAVMNPSFETRQGTLPLDGWQIQSDNNQFANDTSFIRKIAGTTDRVNVGPNGCNNANWEPRPTHGSNLAVIGYDGPSTTTPPIQKLSVHQAIPKSSLVADTKISFDYAWAAGQNTDGGDIFRISLKPDTVSNSPRFDAVVATSRAGGDAGGNASNGCWLSKTWTVTQSMLDQVQNNLLIVAFTQKDDTAASYKVRLALDNFVVSDVVRPTVVASSLPDVVQSQAGQTFHDISVTYADNIAVDKNSLTTGDIRVTGPNGYDEDPVMQSVFLQDGTPLTATYRIAAPPTPSGSWDQLDNGTYTVSLRSNEVFDTSGNSALATTIGSFKVDLDTEPPVVIGASIPDVVPADVGVSSYMFTVTYSDNDAVDVNFIKTGNVIVSGPNGFNASAIHVSSTPNANGSPITAKYQITPPGGQWSGRDSGVYSVNLVGNQIRDEVGNFAVARHLADFTVTIPLMCDGNGDGDCDLDDLDLMYDEAGGPGQFDFTGNGNVNANDLPGWLEDASSPVNLTNPQGFFYVLGDVNLDGRVRAVDLGLLLNNFNASSSTPGTGVGWRGGDLDMDGDVDSSDLGVLLNSYDYVSPLALSAQSSTSATSAFVFATLEDHESHSEESLLEFPDVFGE